jgi:two-component system response regulator GlrR
MARILIVDDDPALLRLLSLRLHYEGHTAIEAANGPTALALLDQGLPQAMITDLQMPGMDGLQLF